MSARGRAGAPAAARRGWTRWLQVVVGLAALGTLLTVAFWLAATLYYAIQRDPSDVTVGATLPSVRQIDPRPGSPDLPANVSLATGEPLAVAIRAPSTGQYTLAVLERLPTLAVYATFFVLLWRLVRLARRDEIFSTATAGRLRGLGGLLLAGALAAALLEAVAGGLLAMTLLGEDGLVFEYEFPGGAVIGGVGLLAAAEIIRRGAGMREDLEGTV